MIRISKRSHGPGWTGWEPDTHVAAIRHDAGSVCHPLTLLLGWFGFAILLPWVHSRILLGVVVLLGLVAALLHARRRILALLRRSRWLLLSLGILFAFFTPGEYVPWLPDSLGVTHEGLIAAADHLGRLLAMLATLALVHERLGTHGLLTALYTLLRPFSFRDATVIRLMLVLEYAEAVRTNHWHDWLEPAGSPEGSTGETLRIKIEPLRRKDLRIIFLGLLTVLAWIMSA